MQVGALTGSSDDEWIFSLEWALDADLENASLCPLEIDDKLEELLPTLKAGCAYQSVEAREGHAMMWVHLPGVLGARFEPHLPEVIPVMLAGLSDDSEPVRDARSVSKVALPGVAFTVRRGRAGKEAVVAVQPYDIAAATPAQWEQHRAAQQQQPRRRGWR